MTGKPIAVTVQYPGYEHEKRIHDLGTGTGFDFVPLLKRPAPNRTDAISYAVELVSGLSQNSPHVGAVVAWCTSSAIGLEVARLLGKQSGNPPVLIALDGVQCTAAHINEAYQEIVHRYAPGRTGELSFTEADVRTRPGEVLGAAHAELSGYATEALLGGDAKAEVAPSIIDEVVAVSMDWLTLLVSSHNSTYEPWHGEVVVVTSSETQFPGAWPGVERLRTVSLNCSAAELISANEIAPLVTEYLTSPTATRA